MIDPYTGEQIGDPVASRLSATLAMDTMNNTGLTNEKVPLLFDLAASLPSAAHTTMWNMGRVSNTLISGSARGNVGSGGVFRQGIPQTFSPRYWRRLGHAQNIDPVSNSTYSPFGALSKTGNFALRHAGRYEIGKDLIARAGGSSDPLVSNFSRGTFGRMAAMARITNMSNDAIAGGYGGIARNIDALRPGSAARMGSPVSGRINPAWAGYGRMASQGRGSLIGGLGSTMDGAISGRASGYFAGAQFRRMGDEVAYNAARRAAGSSTFFREGMEKAFTSNSFATKVIGSRAASLGLRAAGPVGAIMLARDIGVMAGKVVSHAGRTMIDAGVEMMSPLNKGVMGGTYRDNAVAATARQRALGAIGNSRLNAMSVLGNEGAMMYARFG